MYEVYDLNGDFVTWFNNKQNANKLASKLDRMIGVVERREHRNRLCVLLIGTIIGAIISFVAHRAILQILS